MSFIRRCTKLFVIIVCWDLMLQGLARSAFMNEPFAFAAAKFPRFNNELDLRQTPNGAASFSCRMKSRASLPVTIRIGDNVSSLQAQFGRRGIVFKCKGLVRCVENYETGIQAFGDWNFEMFPLMNLTVQWFNGTLVTAVSDPNIVTSPAVGEMVAFQYNRFQGVPIVHLSAARAMTVLVDGL